MDKRVWVTGYRIGFALLTLAALGYQLYNGHNTNPDFRTVNFFSFFTVQSNIFAACVLVGAVVAARVGRQRAWFDYLRGAAVLYMATTGVVYGLLLAGYHEELQTTIPWVNTVVHRIIPIVMVADWFIEPPRSEIGFRNALGWIGYPLLFVTYTLIRGPIVDWYPYPFLDPEETSGYGVVALYCIGIAVGMTLFTWIVVLTGNRHRTSAATPAAAARD